MVAILAFALFTIVVAGLYLLLLKAVFKLMDLTYKAIEKTKKK